MKELQNEKQEVLFYTTYKEAVNWLHNNFVLCNNIVNVDESIYDNMRFSYYNEDDNSYIDVYQWFVTDCTESDIEFLEKYFGLLFTYSDKLDCYILCVDHWGTSWSYVHCPVYGNKENEDYPHCKTYEELTGCKY